MTDEETEKVEEVPKTKDSVKPRRTKTFAGRGVEKHGSTKEGSL